MKTASVANLKQGLSSFLRLVEKGEEVVVTSHRRPIARLIPEAPGVTAIRPPSLPISTLMGIRGVRTHGRVSGVEMLLADRDRR